MKSHYIRFTFFLLFLVFVRCDENYERIPQFPLNIRISLDYLDQLAVGGVAELFPDDDGNVKLKVPVGAFYYTYNINDQIDPLFNGLLIYKVSSFQFIVFDQTCSYLPETNYCKLADDPDWDPMYKCPCCGSRFLLTETGSTTFEGPAVYPLFTYSNYVSNNSLYIQNY